jgi:hypothetical protein
MTNKGIREYEEKVSRITFGRASGFGSKETNGDGGGQTGIMETEGGFGHVREAILGMDNAEKIGDDGAGNGLTFGRGGAESDGYGYIGGGN